MAKKPKTLDVPIGQLTESELNPRRTFDEDALKDLADSIAADGILQTLLVRPLRLVNGRELPGGYEVICGARRLRAATIAGAKTVPVRVRYDLDDVAALEAMVAENSQRADVAPLEESDAYEALLERGRDVAAIAAKLGRSESYVRARLRLQRLGPEGRMLLEHGLLTLTGALALAQLDAAPQRQAVEHMGPALRWPRVENWPDGFEGDEYGHWMPGVASGQHVRAAIKRACRVLAEAPWDLADAQLVPNAGACASCPRRTAAQAELFGDADGEDLCLDGACWEAKVDGWWTARRAELEAAGATVLEGDAGELSAKSREGPGVVLVTVVVAARRELTDVGREQNAHEVFDLLAELDALTADQLVAFEVIWSPAAEDDRMSTAELEALYPEVSRLDEVTVGGRVFCEYCGGPYPDELRACAHCGAPNPNPAHADA